MKSEQQTFIILVENILLFLSCKSNFTTFNVQSFCLAQARSEHPRPHRHCCRQPHADTHGCWRIVIYSLLLKNLAPAADDDT